jgi:putative spermidine/putrescine transport system substrate-binding protein
MIPIDRKQGRVAMTSGITRRQLTLSLGAGMALAGLTGVGAQSNRLVVTIYGGRWEKFWREQILPPFEMQTGIQATLDVGLSVNFAANLRATGPERPNYSYVHMNELVGALIRSEGYVEPWPQDKVPNLKKINPAASIDQYRGVTVGISPIGIAYRKDLVKTPPKSWRDLWDNSEFRGKLALFTITNTAGYMLLMATSRLYGKDPFDFDAGFAAIEKLKPFPQADLASAMAILLTRGEAIAGPLDIGEVASIQKRGAPIGFAVPSEELFAFDQTFYLMKNGPNKDAACKFLDFMLSEDIQSKLAEEFSLIPVNIATKLSAAVAAQLPMTAQDIGKVVTFDWARANQERAAVTERWNRMTR